MIRLSRESMEAAFIKYLETVFEHPEIISAGVRSIVINRENIGEAGKRAFEAGFHDCYSDIDLFVKVCLPSDGSVTADQYMKRIDRFGVNSATALGWCFIPGNNMYRIIFRDGMRYDFGFEFEFEDHLKLDLGEQPDAGEQNDNWPADNINRFWFIQIQALGKLYRKDYLISCHLANMNCNETLVMQMVLRDLKYGTNHHRYPNEKIEPFKVERINEVLEELRGCIEDERIKPFLRLIEEGLSYSDVMILMKWYKVLPR